MAEKTQPSHRWASHEPPCSAWKQALTSDELAAQGPALKAPSRRSSQGRAGHPRGWWCVGSERVCTGTCVPMRVRERGSSVLLAGVSWMSSGEARMTPQQKPGTGAMAWGEKAGSAPGRSGSWPGAGAGQLGPTCPDGRGPTGGHAPTSLSGCGWSGTFSDTNRSAEPQVGTVALTGVSPPGPWHPPVLTQLRAAGRPGSETSRLVLGFLTRRRRGEGVAPAKAQPQCLLSFNPFHALPSRPGAPGGVGGHGDDPAGIQGGERGLQAANPFTHTRGPRSCSPV